MQLLIVVDKLTGRRTGATYLYIDEVQDHGYSGDLPRQPARRDDKTYGYVVIIATCSSRKAITDTPPARGTARRTSKGLKETESSRPVLTHEALEDPGAAEPVQAEGSWSTSTAVASSQATPSRSRPTTGVEISAKGVAARTVLEPCTT